jgi:K+-transporting ATPase ATPase B chain
MVGDGNHDGPAMAQADVSIALNAGSRAAREAGGLIDLDADPTKLVAVVEVGMQVRALRRTLSAWCLSSDLAVGLALVPLVISGRGGAPSMVNPLALCDSKSAVLAGLVVHALVLASVVPLALRKPDFLRGPAVAAPLAALSTLAAIKLFDLLVYHALLAP